MTSSSPCESLDDQDPESSASPKLDQLALALLIQNLLNHARLLLLQGNTKGALSKAMEAMKFAAGCEDLFLQQKCQKLLEELASGVRAKPSRSFGQGSDQLSLFSLDQIQKIQQSGDSRRRDTVSSEDTLFWDMKAEVQGGPSLSRKYRTAPPSPKANGEEPRPAPPTRFSNFKPIDRVLSELRMYPRPDTQLLLHPRDEEYDPYNSLNYWRQGLMAAQDLSNPITSPPRHSSITLGASNASPAGGRASAGTIHIRKHSIPEGHEGTLDDTTTVSKDSSVSLHSQTATRMASRPSSRDETSTAFSDTPAIAKLSEAIHPNLESELIAAENPTSVSHRVRRLSREENGLPLSMLSSPSTHSHETGEPSSPSPLRESFSAADLPGVKPEDKSKLPSEPQAEADPQPEAELQLESTQNETASLAPSAEPVSPIFPPNHSDAEDAAPPVSHNTSQIASAQSPSNHQTPPLVDLENSPVSPDPPPPPPPPPHHTKPLPSRPSNQPPSPSAQPVFLPQIPSPSTARSFFSSRTTKPPRTDTNSTTIQHPSLIPLQLSCPPRPASSAATPTPTPTPTTTASAPSTSTPSTLPAPNQKPNPKPKGHRVAAAVDRIALKEEELKDEGDKEKDRQRRVRSAPATGTAASHLPSYQKSTIASLAKKHKDQNQGRTEANRRGAGPYSA